MVAEALDAAVVTDAAWDNYGHYWVVEGADMLEELVWLGCIDLVVVHFGGLVYCRMIDFERLV